MVAITVQIRVPATEKNPFPEWETLNAYPQDNAAATANNRYEPELWAKAYKHRSEWEQSQQFPAGSRFRVIDLETVKL